MIPFELIKYFVFLNIVKKLRSLVQVSILFSRSINF